MDSDENSELDIDTAIDQMETIHTVYREDATILLQGPNDTGDEGVEVSVPEAELEYLDAVTETPKEKEDIAVPRISRYVMYGGFVPIIESDAETFQEWEGLEDDVEEALDNADFAFQMTGNESIKSVRDATKELLGEIQDLDGDNASMEACTEARSQVIENLIWENKIWMDELTDEITDEE